ncbi:MAG: hypothetical protein GYA73_12480 [Planctomycetes bacterium]|nr:hypothetical protein [Planctomycetota bacterium]
MAEEGAENQSQEGVPVKKYVALLFRYKFFILFIVPLGTALGVVGAILFVHTFSVYDGTKLILVHNPQNQLRSLLEEDPRRIQDDTILLEAIVAEFMDESVLRTVAERCKLDEQAEKLHEEAQKSAGGRFSAWLDEKLSFFLAPPPENRGFIEHATNKLKRDLSISIGGARGSRTISGASFPVTISYCNRDPRKVVEVIRAFIEASRDRRKAQFESNEFLVRQEELLNNRFLQIKEDKERKEALLRKLYLDVEIPFDSDVNSDLTYLQQRELQAEGRIAQLSSDVAQRKAQIAQLEANMAALLDSGAATMPVAAQLDSPEARSVANELHDVEIVRQELKRRLLSTQPPESERVQIQASIEQLQKRWEEIYAKFKDMQKTTTIRSPEIVRVEQDIAVRNAELAMLETELAEAKKQLAEQRKDWSARRTKIAELLRLRSEYQHALVRYEAVRAQNDERKIFKEARAQVEHIQEVTSDIQVSDTPRAIVNIGRRKMVLAAAFGSIALALGYAFLRGAVLDASLHSPADAEHALGLPIISTIPEAKRLVLG